MVASLCGVANVGLGVGATVGGGLELEAGLSIGEAGCSLEYLVVGVVL